MCKTTFYIILITVTLITNNFSQTPKKNNYHLYEKAFQELLQMLNGQNPIDFKRAVFISENPYLNGSSDYGKFCDTIARIADVLKAAIKQRGFEQYKTAGNWAVYAYMMDSIDLNNYTPYTYDFEDFLGDKDWRNTFVTKLINTKKGNCYSLPILYKILCQEIGAKASLALAPNHLYIKHINEEGQWTNLELTNGGFPRDQWIIQQMAISVEAIKNGVYMEPLTDKEDVTLTVYGLLSAYQYQHGYDNFFFNGVDSALQYFPKCMPLLIMKANYFRHFGQLEKQKNNPDFTFLDKNYASYKSTLHIIDSLGYKDMPIEMYEEWVKSVEDEKAKRGITSTTNDER